MNVKRKQEFLKVLAQQLNDSSDCHFHVESIEEALEQFCYCWSASWLVEFFNKSDELYFKQMQDKYFV